MTKRVIPLLVLCLFLTNLSAQTRQASSADDYNAIFKSLKWRSIARLQRSNRGLSSDPVPLAQAFTSRAVGAFRSSPL